MEHVGRGRYLAGTIHLVADADSLPLRVHAFPAQRQHFARPRARHQHHVQAGSDDGCVFRRSVTDRFGIVTAEFGSVTEHFGDVTDGRLVAA